MKFNSHNKPQRSSLKQIKGGFKSEGGGGGINKKKDFIKGQNKSIREKNNNFGKGNRNGGNSPFPKKKKENPNFTKLGTNNKLKGRGDGEFDDEFTKEEVDFMVKKKGVKDFENEGDSSGEEGDDQDGGIGKAVYEFDGDEEKGKKKGKKGMKKKTGGFQSMGLSALVLKGVIRRGYNVPTPIQRKTIPLIMEGRDVVAMARTGSGKTAAFLIPLFEKLHVNRASVGTATKYPRALILSPTRELAVQTVKFFREIGRFVNLKVVTVVGGESMDSQFQTMHDKPDVVIATPGRFMHLLVEMEMKLDGVEYIVFDEADRLFEMGFGEQVTEIVRRLPETRQTVLFSATLPKLLVEFTKAGLHDPSLVRLDVDSKLPERLELRYLACRSEDKLAVLVYLLKSVIDHKGQTIVFAATKHHVDLIHQLLDEQNISNCYIYSSLDPAARKISIAKFRGGKCNVMIVTDIAARGIDIPILDNVINFHFPAKSKLFMHRVGRVARAGRSGTAYSIIAPDEIAFLLDLHLFLNKPLKFGQIGGKISTSDDESVIVGRVPQDYLNEETGVISNQLQVKAELATLSRTAKNGYIQYLKSRPNASTESNRRAKEIGVNSLAIHPMFGDQLNEDPLNKLIAQIQNYRPKSTIFEVGPKSGSETFNIMKMKRLKDQKAVEKYRMKRSSSFSEIGEKKITKDEENFIPYRPKDHHTEIGLSVGTTFDKEIQASVMDITGDDADMLKTQRDVMKWDQKKKKFVSTGKDKKSKKIKTESGTWIAASYKSDRYKAWKERSKVEQQSEAGHSDDDEGDDFTSKGSNPAFRGSAFSNRLVKAGKNEAPGGDLRKKGQRFNIELKRPEQILKDRKVKEKKRLKNMPGKSKKKGPGQDRGARGKAGNFRNKGSSFGKKK